MSTPKSQAEIELENTSNEDMIGTALPWRAYPEPFPARPTDCATATVSPSPAACSAASPKRWRPSSTSASGCAAASK